MLVIEDLEYLCSQLRATGFVPHECGGLTQWVRHRSEPNPLGPEYSPMTGVDVWALPTVRKAATKEVS